MTKRLFALSLTALCFCAAGCMLPGGNSSSGNRRAARNSAARTPDKPSAPAIARETKVLEPSEVEIESVGGTEAGAGGAASQIETRQVEASSARVEQLLSDFNARETEQGIVIDLPENILFDFDKAELKPDALPTLAKINELISFYSAAPVEINGHTDGKGADAYNQSLSEKRARAVKDHLANQLKVDAARMKAVGYGETKPIAPNEKPGGADDPEGRQKNRRVEVVIKK